MTEAEFFTFLHENGLRDLRRLNGNRWAGTLRFMFTHAIIVGRIGNTTGHDDRWCYSLMVDARAALAAWDGEGEPEGWHRHPGSGRRRSVTGDEVDENGERGGEAGVLYVRR